MKVAVVGSSGFVGSAVVGALTRRGHQPVEVSAPRLPGMTVGQVRDPWLATRHQDLVDALASSLRGTVAVVNAAGMSEASSTAADQLIAANVGVPLLIHAACGSRRLVHVSSAAVQGAAPVLDATPRTAPFSAYSRSKALAEELLVERAGVVAYRPAGVHGVSRSVTRTTAKLARSRVSSVAGDGLRPTAMALVGNVGDAVAFLVTRSDPPPAVVSHPSEDVSVAQLLEYLGGRAPHRVPPALALALVSATRSAGRYSSTAAAWSRRLEVLWFGQRQAHSWLTEAGWIAPIGHEGWRVLGAVLASEAVARGRSDQ